MTEGAGRFFYNLRPLKGKRLTTFCASLALLHPLLSLTHWIFRSLMLLYKSSSHSAKCVRFAQGATAAKPLLPPERSEHTPSTQPAVEPRPHFCNLRRSRHHNPRPERPSNLRTLRPIGPVNPKNPPRPAVSAPFKPSRQRRV